MIWLKDKLYATAEVERQWNFQNICRAEMYRYLIHGEGLSGGFQYRSQDINIIRRSKTSKLLSAAWLTAGGDQDQGGNTHAPYQLKGNLWIPLVL